MALEVAKYLTKKRNLDKAPIIQTVEVDGINAIFRDLRQASDNERERVVENLRIYVFQQYRDLSGEHFRKLINEINNEIFELTNSQELGDNLAGIYTIDCLIDVEFEQTTTASTKITRLSNYLLQVLESEEYQVLVLAAQTLGKLVRLEGTVSADIADSEMKKSLSDLKGDGDKNDPYSRKLAAALVLKALAINAPSLFYVHISTFFERIWSALNDSKLQTREAAASALRAALELTASRKNRQRSQWHDNIWQNALVGFKVSTLESTHASLLAIQELLMNAREFMISRFKEVVEYVLRFKDFLPNNKNDKTIVRKAVISLIPMLASFSPEMFASYVPDNSINPARDKCFIYCMEYLLGIVQNKAEEEKGPAFIAIGKLAMGAPPKTVTSFLTRIVSSVKANIGNQKAFSYEAITCLSLLSATAKSDLQDHIEKYELLPMIFAGGLNQELTTSMKMLGENIPSLMPEIQLELLHLLSYLITRKNCTFNRIPITEKQTKEKLPLISFNPKKITSSWTNTPQTENTMNLALSTLASFGFDKEIALDFVQKVIVDYLGDECTVIRKQAAIACASIVRPTEKQLSSITVNIIGQVIEKLLIVGVSDSDPTIRITVLESFDENFDSYLAMPENLRSLFIALNDEIFEMRKIAIRMIGRLTIRNPAFVMPSMRKTLVQLLTELEFSGDSAIKEESASLLGHLINSSQQLIQPYAAPILKSLMTKLNDENPRVASTVLQTIGELAMVSGNEILEYLPNLFPIIIESLQDQSSTRKRQIALKSLGQFVSSTGKAISPLNEYPKLLDILLNMVKSERSQIIRKELLRVIGILGALDPSQYKNNQEQVENDTHEEENSNNDVLNSISPSSDDYAPTAATVALMQILSDSSLHGQHNEVIKILMSILSELEQNQIAPLVPLIMPPFLNRLKNCEPNQRELNFQKLGDLVYLVRDHIGDYLRKIFKLMKEFWSCNTYLLAPILNLVELISGIGDEFKAHLPDLIPQIFGVLHQDTDDWDSKIKVLHTLEIIGKHLDDYLHLLVPALVRLMEQVYVPIEVRRAAIITLGRLCSQLNFADYISRISHPLARVIDTQPGLHDTIMDTLCALVYTLWNNYVIAMPIINRSLIKQKISHPEYEKLVSKILKNSSPEKIPPEFIKKIGVPTPPYPSVPFERNSSFEERKILKVNEQNLQKAWKTSNRSTKDDWIEWMRKFSVELLRNSSSPALRSCLSLAQGYHTLAAQLFNPAFLSCWNSLNEQYRDQLLQSLKTALSSPEIPPEIMQIILNCFEWMERDGKPLPIDIKNLGVYSEKCHAYAKALHYKEIELKTTPNNIENIEALISINNQLQQPDAAIGILTVAQQDQEISYFPGSWYEKLQRWDDALGVYSKNSDESSLLGQMRCYLALGEWTKLNELSNKAWEIEHLKPAVASMATAAAWNIGNWENMEKYAGGIEEGFESTFYKTIICINRSDFLKAKKLIEIARLQLDNELTALVGESYGRAYDEFVKVQQLTELEEVIEYKLSKSNEKERILKLWETRLQGCQRNVNVWHRILSIRSLVLPPKEEHDMWLNFAALCRKSRSLSEGRKIITTLFDKDPFQKKSNRLPKASPQVVYSYLMHLWAEGDEERALDGLLSFTKGLKSSPELLARCHLKLGKWRKAKADKLDENSIQSMISSFKSATENDPNWHKAWHEWAYINLEVLNEYDRQRKPFNNLKKHLTSAINGFFQSISLSPNENLQDTLRILTLWFKYGDNKDAIDELKKGFELVSIDTWLQVIPQIIARIHSPSQNTRKLIQELLTTVGKYHPQALVYPLTVAAKSSQSSEDTTQSILDDMKKHSAILVEQASLVSRELIRVSIIWHEMWHEALEEASRLYYNENNLDASIEVLNEIHKKMECGPETLLEVSFYQMFGRELEESKEWLLKFQKSKSLLDINQAWDHYYNVFKRIVKSLNSMTSFDLEAVSPYLLNARDLELAIPGTYKANSPIVKIKKFGRKLTVFSSKQRPRRLNVVSSNGKNYDFLLKGHEDLRQDERVMQLFGLVNTLLANDPETSKTHLNVTRYSVIPLSPNSGLIGWVPNCDTLLKLIQDYRESKKMELRYEHKRIFQMVSPENNQYDMLSLIQKVEVFEHALSSTDGNDLNNILWLKSRNAEAWLDRRTTYTRSLALMSIVGYILGLGDRHPSNLMLEKINGKIVHIDFGDCFEVAMTREKYPEKVPFRLTRMLIHAMEASGIEGTFRSTCENTMRVLRANKESLMAVLEAFVHDPLLNWRLLGAGNAPSGDPSEEKHSNERLKLTARNYKPSANQPHRVNEENKEAPEVLNEKAVTVISRVHQKLTGTDFPQVGKMGVCQQVAKLIEQATSHENLSQSYVGWCPFW